MKNLRIAVINKSMLTVEDAATLNRMELDGKLVSQEWAITESSEHRPQVFHSEVVDRQDLVKLLLDHGISKVQELISPHLGHRFSVEFNMGDWIYLREFQDDEGLLFIADLTISIPQPPVQDVAELIRKVINSFHVNEFSSQTSELTFRCYPGEGLPVDNIGHVIHAVNDHFGLKIKNELMKLGIEDYQVTFIVSQMYR